MKKLLVLSATLAIPFSASADGFMGKILPLSLQHKGNVEVATGMGSGNIDRENFSVAGKLVSSAGKYENNLKIDYSNVEARGGDSENLYNISNKLKRQIGTNGYGFGELDFDSNKATGINRRTSQIIGYGHNLIKKDNLNIAGEIGAGLRQNDYKPGLEDENSAVGKIGTIINWKPIEKLEVNNDTYLAITQDNRQTVSNSEVRYFIQPNIYAKGGFDVENNEKTPTGFKSSDTISRVGVGYNF
jgi:putative salt-induced outer membrane protein